MIEVVINSILILVGVFYFFVLMNYMQKSQNYKPKIEEDPCPPHRWGEDSLGMICKKCKYRPFYEPRE